MDIKVIGIDIAKRFFQVHAIASSGAVVTRCKLPRERFLRLMADLPPCLVGLEAGSGAHYWGREIARLGHDVRLMPPQLVRPYVKTNKNDAADAEVCCEAVQRPAMRFVPIKSVEQQAAMAASQSSRSPCPPAHRHNRRPTGSSCRTWSGGFGAPGWPQPTLHDR